MVRNFFKKLGKNKTKFDHILNKYNLPTQYFNTNRKMIARGVFIGLFFAFIPMPLQMLAVIALTPFIQFNIFIAITMVWLSNPITMPFMYYFEYLTGNLLLGLESTNNSTLSIEWFTNNFDTIFIPLYTGALFYSIFISSLLYYLITHLWIKSVKNEQKVKRKYRINRLKNHLNIPNLPKKQVEKVLTNKKE